MTILSASNIYSGYGKADTLKGVSIEVNSGEIVTIIGANGAGKTTFLMTLSRFIELRAGAIVFDGNDLTTKSAHELIYLGVAHVPEGRKIFPKLTVLENLDMGAYSRNAKEELETDYSKVYDLFPALKDRSKQIAGTLSGGEQQMLAIGRALMGRPKLLLLDEPSMGIAPMLVEKIFNSINELNKTGLTILLVEQDAHLALQIAERAYVFETGEVTISGKASDLRNDARVKKAYLGE